MNTIAALLLLQEVITEADENRVLLRVITIGVTIFAMSAGTLYAVFRTFEQREKRTDFKTIVLLCVLVAVVVTGCVILLRIAIGTTKY